MQLEILFRHTAARPIGEDSHLGNSGSFRCTSCGHVIVLHSSTITALFIFMAVAFGVLGAYLLSAGFDMLGAETARGNDPSAVLFVQILFLGGGAIVLLGVLFIGLSVLRSFYHRLRSPPLSS